MDKQAVNEATTTTSSGGGGSDNSTSPKRYIYTQVDMEHFKHSSAHKELLGFVSAMGKGLTTTTTTSNSSTLLHSYNPHAPLNDLSPALASLHGSLCCISRWIDPNTTDGLPPDQQVKARFGNPVFRTWHERLTERSGGIIKCLMECHGKYVNYTDGESSSEDATTKEEILKECSELGYQAASSSPTTPYDHGISPKEKDIITELRCYLHDSFGHPIRLDYGTGHECSFIVFLLSLCKIGCFNWSSSGGSDVGKGPTTPKTSPEVIGHASLSILHEYLNVTRGLQRDYMLEPAGSHGVWGLDDYHCVPFYLGACQMRAREQWQQQRQQNQKKTKKLAAKESSGIVADTDDTARRLPDNPYLPDSTTVTATHHADNNDHWDPSIIHNRPILESYRGTYIYLSCIHFIQQIKPGVPFFESSPMLNDISHLGSWSKVMAGLLRLFEGEVLDKLPVVQHFVFGSIFKASWTPSRKGPQEAPKRTFIGGSGGVEITGGMPVTRAPWAK
ncbi:hypothetical protein ACHAWT_010418 [Skeletonema menzelii]